MTEPDHVAAYAALRARLLDLAAGVDDATAEGIAPATPEWRLKDVYAHLAATTTDLLADRVEGAGSDEWTEAQIAPRRDRPLAALLEEWQANADAFDELLPTIELFRRGQVLFDAETHEQDVRGALGLPGARESDAFDIGWGWAAGIVGQLRDGYDAGALCLRTEQGDLVVGAGDVTVTVAADRFELFRAMTGRRSVEQVKAYTWEGEPKIGHLCFLPCRPEALVE